MSPMFRTEQLTLWSVPASSTSTRQEQLRAYYRQSPAWLEVSAQALERAGYRCQIWAAHSGPLQVHHRTYERLGHEAPEDLIVLCQRCHALFHGKVTR